VLKDYLAPVIVTIATGIIFALSNLFGTVQHNSDAIKHTDEQVDRNRGFIIENHDNVIRLQEQSKK